MEPYLSFYNMERDYSVCKTRIGFKIASDDMEIDPASISDCLRLNPSRMHRKGDTWIGKRTGSVCTNARTVWAIDSEWTILEEETVSHHIEYFKSILLPKTDILKRYKEDDNYELSFWITIHTDDAGIGLDLNEDELSFLSDHSNRIHFSVISVSEIAYPQSGNEER